MKTAMQELIDELQKDGFKANHYGDTKTSEILYGIKDYIIENLLEKEKLQIEFAHTTGYNDCYKYQKGLTKLVTPRGATEYYNETYNQNEI